MLYDNLYFSKLSCISTPAATIVHMAIWFLCAIFLFFKYLTGKSSLLVQFIGSKLQFNNKKKRKKKEKQKSRKIENISMYSPILTYHKKFIAFPCNNKFFFSFVLLYLSALSQNFSFFIFVYLCAKLFYLIFCNFNFLFYVSIILFFVL